MEGASSASLRPREDGERWRRGCSCTDAISWSGLELGFDDNEEEDQDERDWTDEECLESSALMSTDLVRLR